MIVELNVENLAIIEAAQVPFGPGFTVLTGETGAGKSLLIDAIELALGVRADTTLVRTGASRAAVNVALDLSDQPALRALCAELGLDLDDGVLYIQREVAAEGRSQGRIGGKPVPATLLKQVGRQLVDLHGQHDHQSLLDPIRHVAFLDDWIGQLAHACLAAVADAYAQLEEARARLRSVRTSLRDREQRLDLLRFQVQEIEALRPVPGEFEQLEASLERLRHAEKLSEAAYGALEALVEQEGCANDTVAGALKSLESAARHDTALESQIAPIRDALYGLEEAARGLRAYVENIENDPAQLEATIERLDALKRLRRKYGEDEDAVLAHLHEALIELQRLEQAEQSEEDLAAEVERRTEDLRQRCADLTELRRSRAEEFADLAETQLRDLAMERARFEVRIGPRPPDASGADEVEFLFSANLGEPPRPLSKIASGGELSRTMLAIKTVLAGRAGVPTLIFDEVDAGLSGRAAATVARKIEDLAHHVQIIVISHLPQIASRASTHYRIEKIESGGRAATVVRRLSDEERVEEIARMLAGEALTEGALANAREMLRGTHS